MPTVAISSDARRWTSRMGRTLNGCSTLRSSSTDCRSRFDRITARVRINRPGESHCVVGMVATARYPRGAHRAWQTATERASGALSPHTQVRRRRKVFISSALAHELVGVVPSDRGEWLVHFGPILLGRFDENQLDRALRLTRRIVRGRDNDRPLSLSLTDLTP